MSENEKRSAEGLEKVLRVGGWLSLALLLGWVLLPTTIGAGVSPSPFLKAGAGYIALLMPALLVLSWFQARQLQPQNTRAATARLASLHLLQALPAVVLFLFYPFGHAPPEPGRLWITVVLILVQIPGLLLIKALLLRRLGLWSARPGLIALGAELLLLGLFWRFCVLPVSLTDTYWLQGRVKSRMKSLQTTVETYAVDWGGRYPATLAQLRASAEKGQYWKEPGVQLCQDYPLGQALADLLEGSAPPAGGLLEGEAPATPCAVRYLPSPDAVRYFIYGYDQKGERIKDKSEDMFLTNS